ncbi:hypothetical protein AB0J86_12970 [Micromonospora sp. NPDC049559]|uniref:hypothetical protein n=1 Tax=Micromonospora sp. NPDC049559 TaxID=3155923 RepID=UPI00343FDE88
MPMLVNLVRVSTRRNEVWRHCESCDELAAMAPYQVICSACSSIDVPPYRPELTGRGWS